jgi:hypothetical protein
MNSRIALAHTLLWVAHPVLQGTVAAVMYLRKLHRVFPVFLTYLLTEIVLFAIVFPAHIWGSYEFYFYSYWICEGISVMIGFKVIHEVFHDVFRPYHTLNDLGTVLFKWAGLVMLLVACVVAAASTSTEQGPLVQAILTVQRCVRVIQVGLILFLLVFSKYLGVSWKQHSFGIALGFGCFSGTELLVGALRASSYISEMQAGIFNEIGYNCAILAWLGYVLVRSEAREPQSTLLMSQRWDMSLSELRHPLPADSLIPMFEGMVDQAFSRSRNDNYIEVEPDPAPRHAEPVHQREILKRSPRLPVRSPINPSPVK